MFSSTWCYGLTVLQFVFGHTVSGYFISELNDSPDGISESSQLTTNVPWEFNQTVAPSQTVFVNALIENTTVFSIVELHSFLYNVSILYDSGEAVGTDIGVVLFPQNDSIEFSIANPNKFPVNVLGFVTPYSDKAPIPGAFVPSSKEMKPYLEVNITENFVKLTIVPALLVCLENDTCYFNSTTYKLYYMYTKEKDFSITSYFDGIRTMFYPRKMISEALEYKLPLSMDRSSAKINLHFAKYPGTGLLFKLVAIGGNGTSSYVVAHTFGCDYLLDKDSCIYLVNTFQRVEVIILCVAGLVLCFCGYEWKSFELSIMTILLVSISVYSGVYNLLSVEAAILTSSAVGFIVGCLTVACASCFKCLHVRHTVAFAVFGLLTSSGMLFYVGVGDSAAFRSKEIYWATFSAIAVSSFLLLYLNQDLSHYLTTSVVGSFITVLTIDYFAGSSLKFLIFDNVRRLSVGNFTEAYISPPFQTPDVVLSVLWFALTVSSLAYQYMTRIMTCNEEVEEIINDTETDRSDIESAESVEDHPDNEYTTFDDHLALLTLDPFQRWLLSGRKS